MFSDGLNGIEGALSNVGILLVGQLLLEGFDGPIKTSSAQLLGTLLQGDSRPAAPPLWIRLERNVKESARREGRSRDCDTAAQRIVDLLDGRLAILDVTVDEGSKIGGGGVDVLLGLGDRQLCHQFIKNILAVFVLLSRHACG